MLPAGWMNIPAAYVGFSHITLAGSAGGPRELLHGSLGSWSAFISVCAGGAGVFCVFPGVELFWSRSFLSCCCSVLSLVLWLLLEFCACACWHLQVAGFFNQKCEAEGKPRELSTISFPGSLPGSHGPRASLLLLPSRVLPSVIPDSGGDTGKRAPRPYSQRYSSRCIF